MSIVGGARKRESSSRDSNYARHPETGKNQKNRLHNVVSNFGKFGRRFSKKRHKGHKNENDMNETNEIFVDLRKFQNKKITVRSKIIYIFLK